MDLFRIALNKILRSIQNKKPEPALFGGHNSVVLEAGMILLFLLDSEMSQFLICGIELFRSILAGLSEKCQIP